MSTPDPIHPTPVAKPSQLAPQSATTPAPAAQEALDVMIALIVVVITGALLVGWLSGSFSQGWGQGDSGRQEGVQADGTVSTEEGADGEAALPPLTDRSMTFTRAAVDAVVLSGAVPDEVEKEEWLRAAKVVFEGSQPPVRVVDELVAHPEALVPPLLIDPVILFSQLRSLSPFTLKMQEDGVELTGQTDSAALRTYLQTQAPHWFDADVAIGITVQPEPPATVVPVVPPLE